QRTKSLQRELRKVVFLGRKSDGGVELRHRYELSVQSESASVIAAAKGTSMSFALDDDRTPMRADVGQAPHRTFIIGSQNQRLAQTPIQQRERRDTTRRLYARSIADVLPAAGEDPVSLRVKIFRIRIDPRRQRRGASYILVDFKVADAHLRESKLGRRGRQCR